MIEAPVTTLDAPVETTAVAADITKSLPIDLQIQVDRTVLTPTTTAGVTVTVRAELALATDKATVTLTLPNALSTTTGDKTRSSGHYRRWQPAKAGNGPSRCKLTKPTKRSNGVWTN